MATESAMITLSIGECRKLTSSRGESFSCFCRLEFGAQHLKDGAHVRCEGGAAVEMGVSVQVECDRADPQSLDSIAASPILVSILEVLPKDKKAKEEKTAILGQMTFDLVPFLLGETEVHCTSKLHPPQAGATQTGSEAEIDLYASLPQSILGEEEIAKSNLLTLRLRSLNSLPESWQPPYPFTFTLSLPLPVTPSQPPRGITLTSGTLRPAVSKDPAPLPSHWLWPTLPSAQGHASLLPNDPVTPVPLEDENGEWKERSDVSFRRTAECDSPRVVWQTARRCWLPPALTSSLLHHLSKSSLWPCEVGRLSVPSGSGKGKGKEEEPMLSFHGATYLDLSPLLYPGTSRVCGAYSLHPYTEAEVLNKTKHQLPSLLTSLVSQTPSNVGKKPLGAGAIKRTGSSAKAPESSASQPEDGKAGGGGGGGEGGEGKSEACAYRDAKTYVYLEIELLKPLVPKRSTSALSERISEYIPPRSSLPRKLGGAEKAVKDFHTHTAGIANTLLEEFRALFGEDMASGEFAQSPEAVDERRRKLLFHLNSTGKYYTFKEQLKEAVVQIVREKYLNKAKFSSKEELQSFLSELYVFLTDQVHVGLAEVLSLEGPSPDPPSLVNCDTLRQFALEAESYGELKLAERYYQERISRADHVAGHWYDCGVFSLLAGNTDRSEQCFKEAVALDQTCVSALLLYGMTCCLDERYPEAAEFFELATSLEPNNAVTWMMRGLYCESACDSVMQEMCFQEASKLSSTSRSKTFIMSPKPAPHPNVLQPPPRALGSLRQPSASSMASGVGGQPTPLQHSTHSLGSESSQRAAAKVEKPSEPAEVRKVTESVVSFKQANFAREAVGGVGGEGVEGVEGGGGVAGEVEGRTAALASVKSLAAQSSGVLREDGKGEEQEAVGESVFLQTASFLLDVHALKFAEMALAHELASSAGLSSSYHVAEARLHLQRRQLEPAIQHLTTAISIDVQDSNAWALLGHAHFLTGNMASAKASYERTVQLVSPPTDEHLVYLRLADIYLREKEFSQAKQTLLYLCRHSPSSMTWRGVGIACYRLGELEEAESALCEANILNNLDPLVWAYLTLVCLKCGRLVESEQALKYAIKVGLDDKSLLDEIRDIQDSSSPSRRPSTTQHTDTHTPPIAV